MTELVIGEGTEVTLHFALKLDDGQLIDSNFDGQPATFVVGDGKLLPGFEAALLGLAAGAQHSLVIAPERGFGQPNPNNVQRISRGAFAPDMALSEGLVVSFADASGAERPGVVKDFDEQDVTIDFNHPLAGRHVTFDVEIVAVKPAITH